MKRVHLLFGVVSPILYAFTVILGGVLSDDYNHASQAISELTAAGAPFRLTLNILFSVSLLLAAYFAITSLQYIKQFNIRLLNISMWILLVISVLSLLWAFFPMDPRGADTTIQGVIHLILAGIVSPLTIICPMLVGLGFRKINRFKGYSIYCLATAAIILVTGVIAALSAQNESVYMGIFTRLTIGSYQQWLAITAMFFYLSLPERKRG